MNKRKPEEEWALHIKRQRLYAEEEALKAKIKQVRSFKIPKSKADVDKLLKTSMNNKVGPIRPKKLLNFCAESLTILLKFSKKRKKKRKRSLKN